jgi:hypothetical protein
MKRLQRMTMTRVWVVTGQRYEHTDDWHMIDVYYDEPSALAAKLEYEQSRQSLGTGHFYRLSARIEQKNVYRVAQINNMFRQHIVHESNGDSSSHDKQTTKIRSRS